MKNPFRPTQPTTAKRKLVKLDVNFVSLVSQGANPGANIVMIKEFDMNKTDGISVNIDEATLTGILQKGLADFLTKKEDGGIDLNEGIQKALQSVTTELSEVLSKSVEEAVAKAMENKKEPEPKDPEGKKEPEKKEPMQKGLEDETCTLNGVTVCKSVIGEEAFAGIIAMQKELAQSQHEALMKSLEVEVEKSYPNLPGEMRDKAILLNSINQMPENIAKMAKEYLSKANDNLGEVLEKSVGSSKPGADVTAKKEAEQKLDALAKEIMEKDGLSFGDAYAKALNTPEGTKLYDQYCAC